jgi:hypothetical protein
MTDRPYLSGVIEGFYGRPWSHAQRLALLPRLEAWGLGGYVYAPKDDLKLRASWREPHGAAEAARLRELIDACGAHGLRFGYAISPGLDVRYADTAELERLIAKVDQVLELGARDVVLLFDDIPHALDAASAARFGSLAAAQAHVAEGLFDHVRRRAPDGRRILCPTVYCRRMADGAVHEGGHLEGGAPDGGSHEGAPHARGDGWAYLHELGARLGPDVDVFWTGDDVVSERIEAASLADVSAALRRAPVIWDNLHANDYDLRRLYLGPLAGRGADLKGATAGFFANPNTPFEVNEVALATLAAYLRDPAGYRPAAALQAALDAWRPGFALHGGGVLEPAALRLLAELCYLPWSSGPTVEARLADARGLSAAPPDPADGRLERLRAFAADVARLFDRLSELDDRELLYALVGVVGEARNECDALVAYLEHRARGGEGFGRAGHLPHTYRRGFAADAQALWPLGPDGIVVAPGTVSPPPEGSVHA